MGQFPGSVNNKKTSFKETLLLLKDSSGDKTCTLLTDDNSGVTYSMADTGDGTATYDITASQPIFNAATDLCEGSVQLNFIGDNVAVCGTVTDSSTIRVTIQNLSVGGVDNGGFLVSGFLRIYHS